MQPASVLYDTDCNICKTIMEAFMTWDRGRGRIRPVPIQSDEGQRLLHAIPPAERLDSFHLVRADGDVVSGGPALAELLRLLPAGGAMAKALDLSPAGTARGYEWVAANRTQLSRFIPAPVKRRAAERLARRRP